MVLELDDFVDDFVDCIDDFVDCIDDFVDDFVDWFQILFEINSIFFGDTAFWG